MLQRQTSGWRLCLLRYPPVTVRRHVALCAGLAEPRACTRPAAADVLQWGRRLLGTLACAWVRRTPAASSSTADRALVMQMGACRRCSWAGPWLPGCRSQPTRRPRSASSGALPPPGRAARTGCCLPTQMHNCRRNKPSVVYITNLASR